MTGMGDNYNKSKDIASKVFKLFAEDDPKGENEPLIHMAVANIITGWLIHSGGKNATRDDYATLGEAMMGNSIIAAELMKDKLTDWLSDYRKSNERTVEEILNSLKDSPRKSKGKSPWSY